MADAPILQGDALAAVDHVVQQAAIAAFALGWVSGETVSADGGQHLNGPNQSQPV